MTNNEMKQKKLQSTA